MTVRPKTRNLQPRKPLRRRYGGPKKQGSNSWMWWVGGIAASLLLTLGIKLFNKSRDDLEVKQEMIQVVHEFPNYSSNANYYDGLVERYHQQAFAAAYSMGGRHTRAKLDAKLYLVQISGMMANKASSDGKTDVAQALTYFNQAIRTSAP